MTQSVTPPAHTPLAHSALRVLDAMLQEHGEPGVPEVCDRLEVGDGVAAVFELWGSANGIVGVCFPRDAAEHIIQLATGQPPAFGAPSFDDAIAEIADTIVAGARDAIGGPDTGVSRPRLVYEGSLDAGAPGVCVPVWTESGTFFIWTAITVSAATPDNTTTGGRA